MALTADRVTRAPSMTDPICSPRNLVPPPCYTLSQNRSRPVTGLPCIPKQACHYKHRGKSAKSKEIRGRVGDSACWRWGPTWTRCCHLSRSLRTVISRSMESRGRVEFSSHLNNYLPSWLTIIKTVPLRSLACRFVMQAVGRILHRPAHRHIPLRVARHHRSSGCCDRSDVGRQGCSCAERDALGTLLRGGERRKERITTRLMWARSMFLDGYHILRRCWDVTRVAQFPLIRGLRTAPTGSPPVSPERSVPSVLGAS